MDPLGLVAQLRRKLLPSGTIVERAVRSGVWEGGTNTINRSIQLAKIAILARLLPPEEFGILGISFLVLAVFNHFSQLGIDHALIQQKEAHVDKYLNTTWVLQVGRGVLLTSVLFFLAPIAASWFGEPRATNVIRALGIGPLLLGLKNPAVVYFRKNLQFHRRFLQILSGTAVNFSVAIAFGVLLGNVWALVAGSVAGNITSLIVSYVLHEYRPQLEIDFDLARELLDYGKWIFGAGITGFLIKQGDDLFVGWLLGSTPLAFYQMAYRFSNAPATELTTVVNNVAFPSLSQVQSDEQKMRVGYFRTLRLTTFLSFPAAIGIAVVAPTFVQAILGTEWLPTIPIIQALALWGAFRALDVSNKPVFNTLARPDIGMKFDVVRVALIALMIYPAATRFEILGVATVLVGAAAVVTPLEVYMALNFIDGAVLRYLRTLLHPVIGSILMGAIVWTLQGSMTSTPLFLKLGLLISVGVTLYAVYTGVAVGLFDYPISNEFDTIKRSLE